MLAVESMVDEVILSVQLIEDPISVLLHSSGKDYNFVNLAELLQELHTVRPNSEE